MNAAEPMDPPAFKPDVHIEPSEGVPVGSKFLNMSDGAQAVRGRLEVRCAAGSIVADRQVTVRSQGVWLNCNDGFILDEELAGVIEEPLGDNRGFIESREQKCVCVILYGEPSSSLFPTSEQESSPRMQMDRGKVEVEEARQTRTRRASILTTDVERNEYEVMRTVLRNWCGSCAKGRAKHSHGCPTSEPSGLLAVKDCRVSSRSMTKSSPTVLVLLRRTHGAQRDCQMVREATEPHAVDCVRVRLDAWRLSEVLFKGDSGSAAQVLVDEMQVERSEEAVVEESPKCLHQSGSEAEDTVQRVESPTQTCARVLREELGSKVVNNSIASSRPDRQVVPSQSEKRDDGHSTRSRVKGKECDGPLAQVGETMGFKSACCEVAELESRWVTRACLDRTGEKGEDVVGATARVEFFQPLRRPAKDDQWQRDGFTMLMSVPGTQEDQQGSRWQETEGSMSQNPSSKTRRQAARCIWRLHCE